MMHKGRIVLSRNTLDNQNIGSQVTLNRDDSTVTKLCDIHVYRVPHNLWRDSFNNILNNDVTETVSVGIIRVPAELRLVDLREEIVQQLQLDDLLPRDFVFLRSVGRSLTTLRGKQELQLKAKHFIPPVAYSPELYILEVTPEIRDALAITDGSSQSPHSRRGSPRGFSNSYRNGYTDKGSNRRLDDDSGVAELSPDEEYYRRLRDDRDPRQTNSHHLDSTTFALDELSETERRRRLEEIENLNESDRQRWSQDQDERRRQAEEDQRRADEDRKRAEDERRRTEEERRRLEEERKRAEEERRRAEGERRQREEDERRRIETEERNRKEEEERRKEEEERRKEEQRKRLEEEDRERLQREEEENQRNKLKNDVARFPSPPPLQMSSPEPDVQGGLTSQQRREERDRLLRELEVARSERQMQEKEREECVKKAKSMQHKTTNRRNEARDMWKKKYFEEKKKTAPLEENSSRLRQELEALHRRLMNTLEGPKDRGMKTVDAKPSEKNNYVIQCTKVQHEIEDLQRRVENAKMKLTAEMKLRNQAEGELRALRAELTQKTTNMAMARQQQYAALTPGPRDRGGPQEGNHRSRTSNSPSGSSRVLRAF